VLFRVHALKFDVCYLYPYVPSARASGLPFLLYVEMDCFRPLYLYIGLPEGYIRIPKCNGLGFLQLLCCSWEEVAAYASVSDALVGHQLRTALNKHKYQ